MKNIFFGSNDGDQLSQHLFEFFSIFKFDSFLSEKKSLNFGDQF